MIQFKNITIYKNHASNLDFDFILDEVKKYFPKIQIGLKDSFLNNMDYVYKRMLDSIRIYDVKRPFSKQPRLESQYKLDNKMGSESDVSRYLTTKSVKNISSIGRKNNEFVLYDAFMMQRLFETMMSKIQSNIEHVHIIFEDKLICTFSEEDWRYHARTFVAGSPSIISTTGIIEAPAKPKEWYIKQMQLALFDIDWNGKDQNGTSLSSLKKYLDYGDYEINFAAAGFILQILFFFITEGEPFCNDIKCRLYNAHWQTELLQSQVQNNSLCNKHNSLLLQFNNTCC